MHFKTTIVKQRTTITNIKKKSNTEKHNDTHRKRQIKTQKKNIRTKRNTENHRETQTNSENIKKT